MKLPSLDLSSLSARLSYGERLHPTRDWLVMLGIAGGIFVLLAVWSVWAFEIVARGGVLGSPPIAPKATNQTSVETIKKLFIDRSVEDQKYADGTYRYADPSQ